MDDVVVCQASGGMQQGPAQGPAGEGERLDPAVVRANVDRAAKMIDQMLEEIMRDLFVEQAASYLTDEQPDVGETQVRGAAWHRMVLLRGRCDARSLSFGSPATTS